MEKPTERLGNYSNLDWGHLRMPGLVVGHAFSWKYKHAPVQASLSTSICCGKLEEVSDLKIFYEYFRAPLKKTVAGHMWPAGR